MFKVVHFSQQRDNNSRDIYQVRFIRYNSLFIKRYLSSMFDILKINTSLDRPILLRLISHTRLIKVRRAHQKRPLHSLAYSSIHSNQSTFLFQCIGICKLL